jgi:hypothetical protein
MFLLPLLVIAAAALVFYRLLHRYPVLPAGVSRDVGSHPAHQRPFWPTTIEGRVGIAAFGLTFVRFALVNVLRVRYLGWAVLIAAFALTGVARFARHDRSASVLIVFVVTAVGALFSLLFLAGEVLLGHD